MKIRTWSRRVWAAPVLLAAAWSAAEARELPGAPAAPATWRLAPEPDLVIGGPGAPYALRNAESAAQRPGGEVVVANAGASQLAVFDGAGRLVRTIGREGDGPGEFRTPAWVACVGGDSLLVWDGGHGRLSLLGPDGRPTSEATIVEGGRMFPRALGTLGGGRLVLDPGTDVLARAAGGPGLRRDGVPVLRYERDGTGRTLLATAPGDRVWVMERDGGFAWYAAPFGPRAAIAVGADAVYVGDGETGEIEVFSADGARRRVLRSPHERWAVTPADVARHRAERLARMVPERRAETEAMLDAVPYPERAPALDALAVDAAGRLWVRAHPRPGAAEAEWAVLSGAGDLVARVRAPAGLEVYEVGADHVLGRRIDDDGAERIVRHPLQRS